MDVQANSSVNLAATEVSLVRGGPFYRARQATRLMRPNQWNLGRRIPILIGVVWLPLVVLTIVLNPTGLASSLRAYRVYSRLFLAIPVLLAAAVDRPKRGEVPCGRGPNSPGGYDLGPPCSFDNTRPYFPAQKCQKSRIDPRFRRRKRILCRRQKNNPSANPTGGFP